MSLDASLGACFHPAFTAALLSNQCPSHRKLQSIHPQRHAKVVTLKNLMVRRCSRLATTMHTFDTRQQRHRGINICMGGEPALHFQPTLRLLRGYHGSGSRLMSSSFCTLAKRPDDELVNDEEQEAVERDLRSSQLDSSSGNSASMGKQLAKIIRDMGGSSSDPKNKLLTQFAVVLNKAYDIGAASAARAVIAIAGKSVDDVLQAKPPAADAEMEESSSKPNTAEFGNLDSSATDMPGLVDSKVDLPLSTDSATASEPTPVPAQTGPSSFGPAPDPWKIPQVSGSEDVSQEISMDSSIDVGEDPLVYVDSLNCKESPEPEAYQPTKEENNEELTGEAVAKEANEEDAAAEQNVEEFPPTSVLIPNKIETKITQGLDDTECEVDEPTVVEVGDQIDDELFATETGEDKNQDDRLETEHLSDVISEKLDEKSRDSDQANIAATPVTDKADILATEDDLPLIQDPILSEVRDSSEGMVDSEESMSEDSELDFLEVRTRSFEPDIGVRTEEVESEPDNAENEPLKNEAIPQILDADMEMGKPEYSIAEPVTEDQEESPSDTEETGDTSEDSRKLAVGLSSIRRRAKIEQPVSIKRPSRRSSSIEESLKKSQPSVGGLDGLKYVKEYAETAKGKMQKQPSEPPPPPKTSDFYTPPPALLNKDRIPSPQSLSAESEQAAHTQKMQKIGTMWWQDSGDDGGNGPNGRGGGGSGSGGNGGEDGVPGEGGWWLQVFVSVLTMTAAVFSVLKAVVKPKDRRTSTM